MYPPKQALYIQVRMTHSAFYSVWTNNLYRVTSDISLSFYGSTIIFCYFTLGRLRILQSSMLSWDCTKIQNTYSTAFFTDVLVQWTAIKQTYEYREIALRLRTHYSTAFLLIFVQWAGVKIPLELWECMETLFNCISYGCLPILDLNNTLNDNNYDWQ